MTCYQVSNINLSSYPDCNDNSSSLKKFGEFTILSATYDDQYVKETIEQRKFDPRQERSFTPLDNIRIKIGKPCGVIQSASISAKIYIISGTETIYVDSVILEPSSDGNYEYLLEGWPDSWILSVGELEQLTKQMTEGNAVKVRLVLYPKVLNGPDFTTTSEVERSAEYVLISGYKDSLNYGLCVRMYGKGEHRVVGLVTESYTGASKLDYLPYFFLNFAQNFSKSHEPFKKYADRFSHFADISFIPKKYFPLRSDGYFSQSAIYNVKGLSACGETASQYFLFTDAGLRASYTYVNSRVAFLAFMPNSFLQDNFFVMLHEMAHSFAGVGDEYLYTLEYNPGISEWNNLTRFTSPNCVYTPDVEPYVYLQSIFEYQGVSYASPKKGCAHPNLYRPSETSLMKNHILPGKNKFNVVSCGYVIAAIKGGNPKSYWKECVGLDTIPITQ
jgi:hypothetical protein